MKQIELFLSDPRYIALDDTSKKEALDRYFNKYVPQDSRYQALDEAGKKATYQKFMDKYYVPPQKPAPQPQPKQRSLKEMMSPEALGTPSLGVQPEPADNTNVAAVENFMADKYREDAQMGYERGKKAVAKEGKPKNILEEMDAGFTAGLSSLVYAPAAIDALILGDKYSANYIQGAIDERLSQAGFDDMDMGKAITEGKIKKAAGMALKTFAQSAPMTLLWLATTRAPGAADVAIAASSGASKYTQLDREMPELSTGRKLASAANAGFWEAASEEIGNRIAFLNKYVKTGSKMGKAAISSLIKKEIGKTTLFKAGMGVGLGALGEGGEELLNFNGEYWADVLLGITDNDPKAYITGSVNSTLLGMSAGGIQGGMTATYSNLVNARYTNLQSKLEKAADIDLTKITDKDKWNAAKNLKQLAQNTQTAIEFARGGDTEAALQLAKENLGAAQRIVSKEGSSAISSVGMYNALLVDTLTEYGNKEEGTNALKNVVSDNVREAIKQQEPQVYPSQPAQADYATIQSLVDKAMESRAQTDIDAANAVVQSAVASGDRSEQIQVLQTTLRTVKPAKASGVNNDQENKQGLSGEEQGRKEPIQAEPNQAAGTEAPQASGVVQAPEGKVESKYAKMAWPDLQDEAKKRGIRSVGVKRVWIESKLEEQDNTATPAKPTMAQEEINRYNVKIKTIADEAIKTDTPEAYDAAINKISELVKDADSIIKTNASNTKSMLTRKKEKHSISDLQGTFDTDQSKGMSVGNIDERAERTDPQEKGDIPQPSFGKVVKVKKKNKAINIKYALIDRDKVITSHSTGFQENKDYPQELQNRDRSEEELKIQTTEKVNKLDPDLLMDNPIASDGRPIVIRDKDGKIYALAGNGRVMAMNIREQNGIGLDEYETELRKRLSEFGIADQDTKGKILVGFYYGNDDLVQLARLLNEKEQQDITPAEMAKSDAVLIANEKNKGNDILSLLDQGTLDLLSASNRPFIEAFISLAITDPTIYRDGADYQDALRTRIENALFMYIFNNDTRAGRLLKAYRSTGESNVKSVLNALMSNVKQIARLRNLIEKHRLLDLDISIDLIDAISTIDDLRAKGMSLTEKANEMDIFSNNQEVIPNDKLPLYQAIATLTNNTSAYQFISGYYAEAYDTVNPDQQTLFSEEVSDKQQYLSDYAKRWLDHVERKANKKQTGETGKKVGASPEGIHQASDQNKAREFPPSKPTITNKATFQDQWRKSQPKLTAEQVDAQLEIVDAIMNTFAKEMDMTVDEAYAIVEQIGTEELKDALNQVDAFHGSGAFFDRFDVKFIGTGEGNQAFGWGIYVSERKGVAADYAKKIGRTVRKISINGEEINGIIGMSAWHRMINEATKYISYPEKHQDTADMANRVFIYVKGKEHDILNAINTLTQLKETFAQDFPHRHALWESVISMLKDIVVAEERGHNLYAVSVWENHTEDVLEWYGEINPEQEKKIISQAKKENIDIVMEGHNEGFEDARMYLSNEQLKDYESSTSSEESLPYNSGEELYKAIIKEGLSPQQTSEFLLRAGIDGIKYPVNALSGGTGDKGWNYVVFDANAINIREHTLYQDIAAQVKFRADGKVELAFIQPDITSGLHEMAHIGRRMIAVMAQKSPKWQTLQKAAEEWSGAKNGEWSTEAEEKFANGFLKYLHEGSAPSPKLKTVFEKIKQWFSETINRIRDFARLTLDKDIISVYDALLGRQPLTAKQKVAAIKIAEQQKGKIINDPLKLEKELDNLANKTGLVLDARKTGSRVSYSLINVDDGSTLVEVHHKDGEYNINGFYAGNNADAMSKIGELLESNNVVLNQMSSADIAEAERQMAAVRKQYEGTDKWLKAPNGKPTNLNERQWLQVRTENFKKWFGDWENDPANASKVVDENGEPMVVYHSTDGNFNIFDIARARSYTGIPDYDLPGFYFTPREEFADDYGTRRLSSFLNFKKPFISDLNAYKRENKHKTWRDVYDKIVLEGYDGVMELEGANNAEEEYIALSPTQIKSATANVGTFSSATAVILDQAVASASPEAQERIAKIKQAAKNAQARARATYRNLRTKMNATTTVSNWETLMRKALITSIKNSFPGTAPLNVARYEALKEQLSELDPGIEEEAKEITRIKRKLRQMIRNDERFRDALQEVSGGYEDVAYIPFEQLFNALSNTNPAAYDMFMNDEAMAVLLKVLPRIKEGIGQEYNDKTLQMIVNSFMTDSNPYWGVADWTTAFLQPQRYLTTIFGKAGAKVIDLAYQGTLANSAYEHEYEPYLNDLYRLLMTDKNNRGSAYIGGENDIIGRTIFEVDGDSSITDKLPTIQQRLADWSKTHSAINPKDVAEIYAAKEAIKDTVKDFIIEWNADPAHKNKIGIRENYDNPRNYKWGGISEITTKFTRYLFTPANAKKRAAKDLAANLDYNTNIFEAYRNYAYAMTKYMAFADLANYVEDSTITIPIKDKETGGSKIRRKKMGSQFDLDLSMAQRHAATSAREYLSNYVRDAIGYHKHNSPGDRILSAARSNLYTSTLALNMMMTVLNYNQRNLIYTSVDPKIAWQVKDDFNFWSGLFKDTGGKYPTLAGVMQKYVIANQSLLAELSAEVRQNAEIGETKISKAYYSATAKYNELLKRSVFSLAELGNRAWAHAAGVYQVVQNSQAFKDNVKAGMDVHEAMDKALAADPALRRAAITYGGIINAEINADANPAFAPAMFREHAKLNKVAAFMRYGTTITLLELRTYGGAKDLKSALSPDLFNLIMSGNVQAATAAQTIQAAQIMKSWTSPARVAKLVKDGKVSKTNNPNMLSVNQMGIVHEAVSWALDEYAKSTEKDFADIVRGKQGARKKMAAIFAFSLSEMLLRFVMELMLSLIPWWQGKKQFTDTDVIYNISTILGLSQTTKTLANYRLGVGLIPDLNYYNKSNKQVLKSISQFVLRLTPFAGSANYAGKLFMGKYYSDQFWDKVYE